MNQVRKPTNKWFEINTAFYSDADLIEEQMDWCNEEGYKINNVFLNHEDKLTILYKRGE